MNFLIVHLNGFTYSPTQDRTSLVKILDAIINKYMGQYIYPKNNTLPLVNDMITSNRRVIIITNDSNLLLINNSYWNQNTTLIQKYPNINTIDGTIENIQKYLKESVEERTEINKFLQIQLIMTERARA